MSFAPEGTRFVMPDEMAAQLRLILQLQRLYDSWGYLRVDTPVLERYDALHPRQAQSFKLSDRDSGLLSLRSDFTPAIARLVESQGLAADKPQRFHYCGKVWHAIHPEIARTREFTQIGLELVGVSNARADAELIHLARESVRAVGLAPRVEIGNPGFVRTLFDLARIPEGQRDSLAAAIDRKDVSSIEAAIRPLQLAADLQQALLSLPDLYGGVEVLREARQLAPWPETRQELDRLEAVLAEFEDDSELLLDLGTARRLQYYTSMVFRAYTFDLGQPLLGGGRYDGALLPYAAGFTIGLERLMQALPQVRQPKPPLVLALDDIPARALRKAGFVVERALSSDAGAARHYALKTGIAYLLSTAGLEPLVSERPRYDELLVALETAHG